MPILMCIILFSVVLKVQADEKGEIISTTEFINLVEKAIGQEGLSTIENNNLDGNMTREKAAVLINQAYEIKYSTDYDEVLYKEVVDNKCISDIDKIAKQNREAVYKNYIRGLVIGDSNGKCTQDRSINGDKYLTKSESNIIINRIINKVARKKISPDGQVIRTSELPKNTEDFPYILESFPNSFYESKFKFMNYITSTQKQVKQKTFKEVINSKKCVPIEGKEGWYQSKEDFYHPWSYTVPADIMEGVGGYYSFSDKKYPYKYTTVENNGLITAYRQKWCDLIENYVKYKFNVNYKTIDKKWGNKISNLVANSSHVSQYVKDVKKNKVIIELKQVTAEPSTLYEDGGYYIRTYLKYRVKTAKSLQDLSKVFLKDYTGSAPITVKNLKIGKWNEVYIDFSIGTNVYMTDGSLPDFSVYKVYPDGDYGDELMGKMLAPTSGYKMVLIKSGTDKGKYKWVLR